MLIIAHRGASAIYPENTQSAFTHALDFGAHGLELDIQCSKENIAIVLHDDTLDRTTNGTGYANQHTIEELQNLTAEGTERIITLQELFNTYAGKTTLWIEIKDPNSTPEIVQSIEKIIAHNNASYQDFVIIGFDTQALKAARQLNQHLQIGYSFEEIPEADTLEKNIKELNPHFIVPCHTCITQELVTSMHALGISTIAWTINTIQDSLHMQSLGVNGIITDVPNILHELFHG